MWPGFDSADYRGAWLRRSGLAQSGTRPFITMMGIIMMGQNRWLCTPISDDKTL
jgi:hypothetical protein